MLVKLNALKTSKTKPKPKHSFVVSTRDFPLVRCFYGK